MNKNVVYSAVFGRCDIVSAPKVKTPGVDYILFTDDPAIDAPGWEIRYFRKLKDPRKEARRCKIQPYLKEIRKMDFGHQSAN